MDKHKHNFHPLMGGKYYQKKNTEKYVLGTFFAACMCGAVKTIKVKTINGRRIEKEIL